MPEVSIILPTYNRVDVIGRAVASVILQTHDDWELIVVDDGSTDGTVERLQGLDPRLRIVRQANQGVYAARNAGLAAAGGRYITFLDSDDEWLPHFLALTTAFLRAHPDAHWVTTEFHEDLGDGSRPILHDHHDIAAVYCGFARSIRSNALDLPQGLKDDYLRVYARKRMVGDWGRDALDAIGLSEAFIYDGDIHRHMRWGYLNWLPVTVLTRHALDVVGPFTTHTRSAADYRFLARLARHFPAHMIAIPSAIKYERAAGNQTLAQGHLATGAGAYRFEVNKLAFFDELYAGSGCTDAETLLLRRHYCLAVGHRALGLGHRAEAIRYLRQAAAWRPMLWRGWLMLALAQVVPGDRAAATVYSRYLRGYDVLRRLATGRLTPGRLIGKVVRRLGGRGGGAATSADEDAAGGQTVTDTALSALDDTRAAPAPRVAARRA